MIKIIVNETFKNNGLTVSIENDIFASKTNLRVKTTEDLTELIKRVLDNTVSLAARQQIKLEIKQTNHTHRLIGTW